MKYRLRTLFIVVTVLACSLVVWQSEDVYFRWKYGPRVPAREIEPGISYDLSLGLTIRGEHYLTDDSKTVWEYVAWPMSGKNGPPPDTRIRGVWETPFEDRPYVIKMGRETLFCIGLNDCSPNGQSG